MGDVAPLRLAGEVLDLELHPFARMAFSLSPSAPFEDCRAAHFFTEGSGVRMEIPERRGQSPLWDVVLWRGVRVHSQTTSARGGARAATNNVAEAC
eukprot:11091733-Alexandrium_andersonii.AAC.1